MEPEDFDREDCARTLARIFWSGPPSITFKTLKGLTVKEIQYLQWAIRQQPGSHNNGD